MQFKNTHSKGRYGCLLVQLFFEGLGFRVIPVPNAPWDFEMWKYPSQIYRVECKTSKVSYYRGYRANITEDEFKACDLVCFCLIEEGRVLSRLKKDFPTKQKFSFNKENSRDKPKIRISISDKTCNPDFSGRFSFFPKGEENGQLLNRGLRTEGTVPDWLTKGHTDWEGEVRSVISSFPQETGWGHGEGSQQIWGQELGVGTAHVPDLGFSSPAFNSVDARRD